MEKNQKTEKKEVSNIKSLKLNISYVDFIKRLDSENLLAKQKEVVIEQYLKDLKLKSWRNIKRVSSRVKREELRVLLTKELKERKIELSKFIELDSKLVELFSKKESNYIKV